MDNELNKKIEHLTDAIGIAAGTGHAALFAVQAILLHLKSPELNRLLHESFERHHSLMPKLAWADAMNDSFFVARQFLEGALASPSNTANLE